MVSLTAITLMLALLGTLVFRWQENTIWFVVGVGKYLPKRLISFVDFLYAMTFVLYLNMSKQDLNDQKEVLTKRCQKQKEEDAAALAEEGILLNRLKIL